nr:MAG TPA: hypothetical protein [Caudoviricetes sp.]
MEESIFSVIDNVYRITHFYSILKVIFLYLWSIIYL